MPSFAIPQFTVLLEPLWVSAVFLLLSTGPNLDGTISGLLQQPQDQGKAEGLAACNSQTASPFGCLNNFYFKILSNFLGSLHFKAGADFCYPIMRLNFWRKWRKFGVNPLLPTQKIKRFQGFAASLSTCRPCRDRREQQVRGVRACRPPGTRWSVPLRRRKRRSPERSGSPWRDR